MSDLSLQVRVLDSADRHFPDHMHERNQEP